MKSQKACPICENDLEIHSNEQLQQCALEELSKINRKSLNIRGKID